MAIVVLAGACASAGGERDDASGSTGGRAASTSTAVSPTSGSNGPTSVGASTTVPSSSTTTSTTTTTTAPAVPGGPPTTAPSPVEIGNLISGSTGARSQALQKALLDQHYDPGPIDGQFGTKTAQSVWAWQALHGLPRDGIVTPQLEQMILARPTQSMLRPDLGPTHSEVDLARQVLLVFQGGNAELITHVSTGSGRHYCDKGHCGTAITPPGSFHYQRRIAGWRQAPLGLLYNPVYFNGGIAVHGAPSVPNFPASHGCVRIPMHIAQYFPGLVANGEPIAVV